jgi:hypothetical protein
VCRHGRLGHGSAGGVEPAPAGGKPDADVPPHASTWLQAEARRDHRPSAHQREQRGRLPMAAGSHLLQCAGARGAVDGGAWRGTLMVPERTQGTSRYARSCARMRSARRRPVSPRPRDATGTPASSGKQAAGSAPPRRSSWTTHSYLPARDRLYRRSCFGGTEHPRHRGRARAPASAGASAIASLIQRELPAWRAVRHHRRLGHKRGFVASTPVNRLQT